jgi:hypothetical protein
MTRALTSVPEAIISRNLCVITDDTAACPSRAGRVSVRPALGSKVVLRRVSQVVPGDNASLKRGLWRQGTRRGRFNIFIFPLPLSGTK